jgi:hypothetical protein
MGEIIGFRVVKEPYGWAVRLGEGMMTPFRSQAMALQHAAGIVEALRRCGEFAEVVVVEDVPTVTGVRASRAPTIRDPLHDGRI